MTETIHALYRVTDGEQEVDTVNLTADSSADLKAQIADYERQHGVELVCLDLVKTPAAPRIIDCTINHGGIGSRSIVTVNYSNGHFNQYLFSFFPDEVSFTSSELIGLTEDEARSLFFVRDRKYLGGGNDPSGRFAGRSW